jgi:ATP-dependent helicase HepA
VPFNSYRDLVFGVQAARRRVERDALGLGGALGVAANLLPHQIANVARILSDIEVRHLLADEVGLGKTIQALMVLNALRLARPGLRAAILVPNELMTQWRDELRARGQQAPSEGVDDLDGFVRPVLLWPKKLKEGRLDLSVFDLLIVDELHQLTDALQREVADAAPSIESLLVLTATPPLRDPERMDRLMALIEPTRARTLPAGVSAIDWLLADERGVADRLEGPDADERPTRAAAAAGHATSRRILRTRRKHWLRHLPSRECRLYVVEPTDNERERQRLMWAYFAKMNGLTREFELDLLAQRAIRSPASLRQRVTYLKGHGHERDGLLDRVQDTLDNDHADTRFDALCDILLAIWAEEPDAKVLIAAGDNLTVDDLGTRLPKLFDGSGRPLQVAKVRNLADAAEAISDAHEFADAVASFWSGEAQVLAAARVGNFGLNLQCARHLVLYSVPWDPQETEQWIGRIDRIGNQAIDDGDGGYLPIVIHVPVRRGLIDQRVVDVMRATGILERSLNLDGEAVRVAREAIEDAALHDDPARWLAATARAAAIGALQELDDLDLPLSDALPGAPQSALALHKRLAVDAEPIGPVPQPEITGDIGRERAIVAWLYAMEDAGEYDLRKKDPALGIWSLGYPARALRVAVTQAARKTLDETLIDRPDVPVYFRTARHHLEQPPLTDFLPNEDRPRKPLYFLDHGSPLHEDLLRLWAAPEGKSYRFAMALPAGHPLAALRGSAVHLRVARLDPTSLLSNAPGVPTYATEADRRFIMSVLPAGLACSAVGVTSSGKIIPISEASLHNLLAPPGGAMKKSDAGAFNVPWLTGAVASRAEGEVRDALSTRAADAWAAAIDPARDAVRDRCYVLAAEQEHRQALATRDREAADGARRSSRLRDIDEDLAAAADVTRARVTALSGALQEAPSRALRPVVSAWIQFYA